jgi:hypothetical protein
MTSRRDALGPRDVRPVIHEASFGARAICDAGSQGVATPWVLMARGAGARGG